MGFHTFDPDRAEQLDDPTRYAYLSVDEFLALFDPEPDDVVADIGSGTGFYTGDVAAVAGTVYAVDIQPEMHEIHREKGMSDNVVPVTAGVETLPIDEPLDAVVSTMTFHEFATPDAMDAIVDALGESGRVALADWTSSGTGTRGPPLAERYDVADAVELCEAAGITVHRAEDRRETFVLEGSV